MLFKNIIPTPFRGWAEPEKMGDKLHLKINILKILFQKPGNRFLSLILLNKAFRF
jgi:hypothetical protein